MNCLESLIERVLSENDAKYTTTIENNCCSMQSATASERDVRLATSAQAADSEPLFCVANNAFVGENLDALESKLSHLRSTLRNHFSLTLNL